MSKPYLPLFTGDYLRDTRGLTLEQHGAYLLLLMELWNSDGELPLDHAYIARILGVSQRRWEAKIWPVLAMYFETRSSRLGDTLIHKRLAKELEKSNEKSLQLSNAGKRGAAKKWEKSKGDGWPGHSEANGPAYGNHIPNQSLNTTGVSVERAPAGVTPIRQIPRKHTKGDWAY